MIPTDAVLLGVVVVGFVTATPLVVAVTGLLIWGTRPRGTGRRKAD